MKGILLSTKPSAVFLALAVVIGASTAQACSHIPFKVYVEMAESALKSKDLGPAVREDASKWLSVARDGNGPLWTGERQQALNKALRALDLPQATRGPDREVSAQQRDALLRADAEGMPQQIDELIALNTPATEILAEAKCRVTKSIGPSVSTFIPPASMAARSICLRSHRLSASRGANT